MGRFKVMCKDDLLGPRDYGIFEDWLAIDRSQDRYICIRDGLVLEGEIQEMNNEQKILGQGAIQGPRSWIFLGVPPGGCLSLGALVPSKRIGALLHIQGKSGVGNVSRLLVYIFLL
jgi:hypothetical protein